MMPKFVVAAVLIANCVALLPELANGRSDLNDSVFHYTLIERVAATIERGGNPLDFWAPEWTLGYPVPRTYQILGHLLIASLHILSGKLVSLQALFSWARYLLIALLPLTVFVTGRMLMLAPTTAAAAALVSPLISTNSLFGIEYGSYVWQGTGLFTQSLAMHLLLITLGLAFRAMHGRRTVSLAGVVLGLTFLSHFIYGYMGALSVCLAAFLPAPAPLSTRLRRLIAIGVVAFAVSSFQVVSLVADGPLINHSRWEPAWKWDSFGASAVLQWLVAGQLLDFGRFPSLSLLMGAGVLAVIFAWRQRRTRSGTEVASPFVLAGSILWVLLFCGRPLWGHWMLVFGASQDLQLHRLIGGIHIFFIFLTGIGLSALWTRAGMFWPKQRSIAAITLTAILLVPAVRERERYLQQGNLWARHNLSAFSAERSAIEEAIGVIKARGDRAYAGLAAGWGKDFRVGDVPFYAFLSMHHVPAVAFLYHSMALTSDVMVLFNETNLAEYRLFNISTVVTDGNRSLPPGLTPAGTIGRFQLFDAGKSGYFDLVDVPYSVRVDKQNFLDVNTNWLLSPWPNTQKHLLLQMTDDAAASAPRLQPTQTLPDAGPPSNAGSVLESGDDGVSYRARVRVAHPSYVLFKMTYHPNWRAVVDGEPARTAMLSPGFLGIPMTPGEHSVELRYAPGGIKYILLISGGLAAAAAFILERRSVLTR